MNSDDRNPLDLAQFGLTFGGLVLGIAGVTISSVPIAVFGALLCGLGVAYFALEASKAKGA